jgi:hypothetical protein
LADFAERLGGRIAPVYHEFKKLEKDAAREVKAAAEEANAWSVPIPHFLPFTKMYVYCSPKQCDSTTRIPICETRLSVSLSVSIPVCLSVVWTVWREVKWASRRNIINCTQCEMNGGDCTVVVVFEPQIQHVIEFERLVICRHVMGLRYIGMNICYEWPAVLFACRSLYFCN